ncbi:cupin [Accumulibacter sp.]|uniref:cupin n=1 Tax=Accumulibacter sp. TaxID=2053492 RepID=UPI0025D9A855|nr:cupin [Accumulibacter sp.]MCM8593996.1 cupin [Accumulibacter sp.]MCM8624813.1 cupin [Accumulibacter sp.]MDS4048138.1 cupin [Accumulibacter sp.]
MPNLFANLPAADASAEEFSRLLVQRNLVVERIVSSGQSSPPGFWYDQPNAEWILLIQGEASLRFADEPESRQLVAGDYLDIAAHRRHRVEATSARPQTIWLTIHYRLPELSG